MFAEPSTRKGLTADIAETIERLHALPDVALFTPSEAAIYMNTRLDLLRNWRWRQCGPRFVGRAALVRYRKSDLDHFLNGREQPPEAA